MKTNRNLTLITLLIASFTTLVSADITDVINKQYAFDQDGEIALANINGDVSITACDCSEVNLIATITASDQETRDRITVDIESSQSSLSIQTKYAKREKRSFNRHSDSKVTYELSVPNDVFLKEINLINGNLEISGVTGKLSADLINGKIESDGMTSNTKVNTVNGAMILTFKNLSNADNIDLNSVNGAIIVRIPSDANIKVSADTISGKISNEFGIKIKKGQFVGASMNGEIGDGSTKLFMNNVNGKIQLNSI